MTSGGQFLLHRHMFLTDTGGQGRCEGIVGFEGPRSKRAVAIAGVWPTAPTAQPVVRNESVVQSGDQR